MPYIQSLSLSNNTYQISVITADLEIIASNEEINLNNIIVKNISRYVAQTLSPSIVSTDGADFDTNNITLVENTNIFTVKQ